MKRFAFWILEGVLLLGWQAIVAIGLFLHKMWRAFCLIAGRDDR